jgi:hypothetical protein
MKEEIVADEGMCDVGHHESPCEIPAESKVEAEEQPSVDGGGGGG